MKGYGLPVTETVVHYHPTLELPGLPACHDAVDLRRFLTVNAVYPIFGKPRDSVQSLGSTSLKTYDPATDTVQTMTGEIFDLEQIIGEIIRHYEDGYLFQTTVLPHSAVREICGDRLATVRVMTVNFESGPEIYRACWKIPAGANVADNFWRPGNILAELDLDTGTVKRAFSGIDINNTDLDVHPDSGAPLVGVTIPNWAEICKTALNGAAVMNGLGLIGWDIAPTDEGCVLVEANGNPDLLLPQLADRRGILEPRFREFLDRCVAVERNREKDFKASVRKQQAAGLRRVLKGLGRG